MTFSDAQVDALKAGLNRDVVKQRDQSGRKLSYVEGWHVIAEANRIFGFDAWSRKTIFINCVSERERKIGRQPNQKDGWGVSYVAKVRIDVGGVVREGVGAGHGIDVDVGIAHESAIKEAETDAMKRAMSTFGNPFGLALYDKGQTNVVDATDDRRSEIDSRYTEQCVAAVSSFDDDQRLIEWWNSTDNKQQRVVIYGDGKNANSVKDNAGYKTVHAAVLARIGEIRAKQQQKDAA